MNNISFVPDYDPSLESQSEEWIIVDKAMSEDGEAQHEEERSTKDISDSRTVRLTESTVGSPVIPDVKVPDSQSVSRRSCSDTHWTHIRKYHCPIWSMGLYWYVKRHVLRSHLPWFWIGSLSCWECRQLEGSVLSLTVNIPWPSRKRNVPLTMTACMNGGSWLTDPCIWGEIGFGLTI